MTRDAVFIQTAFEELEVGGLIVGNVPSFRVDQMPYGGVKELGIGTGRSALLDRGHDRAQTDGDGTALGAKKKRPSPGALRNRWKLRLASAGRGCSCGGGCS